MKRIACLFLVLVAGLSFAQEPIGAARYRWLPVTGADGYKLFWGTSSGDYPNEVDLGLAETVMAGGVEYREYTIQGLPESTTVYAAIKPYNGAGEAENYSNEVQGWPNPQVIQVAADCDPVQGGGSTCVVWVAGFEFAVGIQVEIPYAGVTLNSILRESSRSIRLNISIAADATGGQAEVHLRNPWSVTDPPAGYPYPSEGYAGITVAGDDGLTITPIVLPGPATGLQYISR